MNFRKVYLWVEINANRERICRKESFSNILDKCESHGVDVVILEVKNLTGGVLYQTKFAPHLGCFDRNFSKEMDYLSMYLEESRRKNLKIYPAVNVFTEGMRDNLTYYPSFKNKHWQTWLYGVTTQGKKVIKPMGDIKDELFDLVDDFYSIFVNPLMEEVQEYEINLIKEIVQNYEISGIVLDRVRFAGLSADFGDYSREKFEEFVGHKVKNWPEDILKIEKVGESIVGFPGPFFRKWQLFRAYAIKEFVRRVREELKSLKPELEIINYVNSPYSLSYKIGANWGIEGYIDEQEVGQWSEVEKESYASTGYGGYFDKLICGFYYPYVTIEEDNCSERKIGNIEWAIFEAKKVLHDKIPLVGGLFVKYYTDNPNKFRKAMEMCLDNTSGCMLFDLCYIEEYKLWDVIGKVLGR